MTRAEFKEAYLTNVFIFLEASTSKEIQEILYEFGIKLHTGDGIIESVTNPFFIGTFPKDNWHDFEFYQKVEFVPYGLTDRIVDIDNLIVAYKSLPIIGRPNAGNVPAQTRIPMELRNHIIASGQTVSEYLKMVALAHYNSQAVRDVVEAYNGRE